MLTIFIIEDDHNFLVNTINGINMSKDFKIVGTLQKGSDIKQHIEDVIKADIILVDESIPEISPVGIMSLINAECVKRPSGAKSIKAIMSDNITPKNIKKYLDYGYQAVIDKNLSVIENLNMLERLYMEKQKRIMNYEKYINYKIDIPEFHGYLTNILHEVGIPASLKGYMYLKRAIEIAFLCLDTVVGGITKIIYPSVAEYYNTTPSRVERAMRHAIETGWLRGNVDIIENIFSYSYSSEKGKPTNGEFIANIADHLAVKFRDEQRKIIEKIENTNNVNKQIDKYSYSIM